MKRIDVLVLHDALLSVNVGVDDSMEFRYAVAKNLKVLKEEVESIRSIRKPSDKFMEYEKKRVGLIDLYAEKDESDGYVFTNPERTSVKISDANIAKFSDEMSLLKEEYASVLAENETAQLEFEDFLNGDIVINLEMVKLSDINGCSIPQSVFEGLLGMIKR